MIYYSRFFTSLSVEGARQEGVPRVVSDSLHDSCNVVFLGGSGHSLNRHPQKVQFFIRSVVAGNQFSGFFGSVKLFEFGRGAGATGEGVMQPPGLGQV